MASWYDDHETFSRATRSLLRRIAQRRFWTLRRDDADALDAAGHLATQADQEHARPTWADSDPALRALTDRERQVVVLRYGLTDSEPKRSGGDSG